MTDKADQKILSVELQILSIIWGVKNMDAAIVFWSEALNYQLKRTPDTDFAILVPKTGEGLQLSLKLTASESPKRQR